jgi:hypothetical protein
MLTEIEQSILFLWIKKSLILKKLKSDKSVGGHCLCILRGFINFELINRKFENSVCQIGHTKTKNEF